MQHRVGCALAHDFHRPPIRRCAAPGSAGLVGSRGAGLLESDQVTGDEQGSAQGASVISSRQPSRIWSLAWLRLPSFGGGGVCALRKPDFCRPGASQKHYVRRERFQRVTLRYRSRRRVS